MSKQMNKQGKLMLSTAIEINSTTQFRMQRQGGVDYQVYPCVMLVEGVHHGVGSEPVYYPPQVLEASAPHWNNMPVTFGHPVNAQGEHVLCNHDGTIRAQWEVGRISNVRFENAKLKGDLWLNVARITEMSPALLQFIQNGGQLEVSTGLLAAEDGLAGTWNEEEYAGTIASIIPDHLALLPNSTGACSWDDGCGVRVNAKAKESQMIVMEQSLNSIFDKVHQYIDSLDVRNADGDYRKINYVRAVFADYFIYRQDVRNNNQSNSTTLFKQSYSVNTNNELVLQGDPMEVTEDVTYSVIANAGFRASSSKTADSEPNWGDVNKTKLPRQAFADQGDPQNKSTWKYPHHWVRNGGVLNDDGVYTTGDMYLHKGGLNAAWAAAQGARSGQEASSAVKAHLQAHRRALDLNTQNNEEDVMAGEKKCCEEKVNALIANEDTTFVETDREWLSAMNEEQIEKLGTGEEVKVNNGEATPAIILAGDEPVTLKGYLETAPDEIRAVLNAGLRELDNKRAGMIAKVIDNERNKFTEDQLKEMDVATLESITSLIPTSNYHGQAPAHTVVNDGSVEEAYIPQTLSDNLGKKATAE